MKDLSLSPVYLRLMGCLAWTVALIAAIAVTYYLVKSIITGESALCIVTAIITLILILVLGSALGLLFYQVAALLI